MGEYSKKKIVIIGAGKMAAFHAQKISALPQAKLIGFYDVDFVAAQKRAAQHPRTLIFPNLEAALEKAEALIVASSTPSHFAVATAALKRKIPCLVEKPLAATAEQARALAQLADKQQTLLAVGHIERYNPAFLAFLNELHHELILKLSFRRFSPYPERMQNESIITDMMIHDLDLALALAGDTHVSNLTVTSQNIKSQDPKNPDQLKVKIAFDSGLIAEVEAHRDWPEKIREFTVLGEHHEWHVDLLNKKVTPWNQPTPIEPVDQLAEEDRNFVAATRNKRNFVVPSWDGVKALELAEMIAKEG